MARTGPTFRRLRSMKVKLRLPALPIVFSAALATSAIAQVQTGSILVKANDAQGAVVPGVAVTISSPVLVSGTMTSATDAGGACRFPVAASGRLLGQDGAPGLPVRHPREHRRRRRPDDAGRSRDERGGAAGERHRHGRVAGHRHDQRERQRHPQPGSAADDAERPRHLVVDGIQGARSRVGAGRTSAVRPAGCRERWWRAARPTGRTRST